MDALLRVIAATAPAAVRDHLRRLATATIGALAVGILLTASAGCAAASLWIFAIPLLGPAGAPLAVSAALLAVGVVTLLVMRRRPRPVREHRSSRGAADTALSDAMRLFKDDKSAGLLAAVAAGLAAGREVG